MHLDAPGQRHGQQPVSGTADPRGVKQDKSSRGSVDTTKTRLGPQRVRLSSGERPIGKGKQPSTEALCQTPPPQGMEMLDNLHPAGVKFPKLVVVSTLRMSLSWERFCVKQCQRRRGRDAKGQKQHL